MLKNYSQNTIQNYVCQIEVFLRKMSENFTEPAKVNEKKQPIPINMHNVL